MEKLVKQIINRNYSQFFSNWPKDKDWIIKILSLFLAVSLWYFVVGEDKVDTNIIIPVEILNLPRDLIISNQFKKELELTVSGTRGAISRIARKHITRPIDLIQAKPGRIVIRNDPDSISLPKGVEVLRIQPTHITLLLDRLIEKNLPIQAKIKGPPASGFKLASIVLEPSAIHISGPQAILGDVKLLITEPIDITAMKGSTTKQTLLTLKPAIVDLIGDPVVTARITIKEKTMQKHIVLDVTVVTSDNQEVIYKITPTTVKIRADLPISVIKNTQDINTLFAAQVTIEKLPVGKHDLAVNILAPDYITIMEVSPQTVTINIEDGL